MIHIIEERLKNKKAVLIAEIGVNYYDIALRDKITPMQAAKKMITEAKKAGVHAVKFQSYKAETLAMKTSPAYWDLKEESTKSQFELFKKFDSFGEKEYVELAGYAESKGVEFLSTPFDLSSADYLDALMNCYKISSSDLNNHGFIKYIAKKNKPVILSVGASNVDEIDRSVDIIKQYNDKTIALLHCVLEYPTPYEHANLSKINTLKTRYPECIIGYSDHTKPNSSYDVLRQAYCYGARIIEKHFTLDKSLKGNDHYHAMDFNDAYEILKAFDQIDCLAGEGTLRCLDTEMAARKNARRSLVAQVDIPVGTILTEEMITWKRPGTGITADKIDEIVGKTAMRLIKKDECFKEEDLVAS